MATGCEYSFEMVNSTDDFFLRSPLVHMTVRMNCSFTFIVSVVKASLPFSAAFTRPGPCLHWENKDFAFVDLHLSYTSLSFLDVNPDIFKAKEQEKHLDTALVETIHGRCASERHRHNLLPFPLERNPHPSDTSNKVNFMQNHQITIAKQCIQSSEVNLICEKKSVYSPFCTMCEPEFHFSNGLISSQNLSQIINLKQPPRSSGWEDKSEFVMGSWAVAESILSFS